LEAHGPALLESLIEPSKAEGNSPREDEMETFKKQVHTGRPTVPGLVGMSMTILSLGLATGCTKESAAKSEPTRSTAAVGADSSTSVLATIGDEKITLADVSARSGDQLEKLETQYQLTKSRIIGASLDSLIRDKTVVAEAKKRGKSVDELVAAEAGPGGFDPSEAEIAAWYQENPSRVGGRPLDQLRSQISQLLRTEKQRKAERKLEERLRGEHKVTVSYAPYRLQLDNAKAPTLGKSDAPITLVEFSDFQCPFCKGMAPTLKEVTQKLGDKVQIVYRQYPLTSIHPFAAKAAEASLCANEQGKFWEMHDAMFEDQTKLAVKDLKATAVRLGMDGKKFDTCLDSGRHVEQVQNDQREGQRAGVTGTPAIFINGVQLPGGSVPYSTVEAAIQEELGRAKR
jgi:protein-disulfide isomerase